MLGLKQHHLFAYIQQKGERYYKRLRIEKTGLLCEEKLPMYLIGSKCCKVEIAFSKAHMKFAILTKSFCILINPKYFESSVEKYTLCLKIQNILQFQINYIGKIILLSSCALYTFMECVSQKQDRTI